MSIPLVLVLLFVSDVTSHGGLLLTELVERHMAWMLDPSRDAANHSMVAIFPDISPQA